MWLGTWCACWGSVHYASGGMSTGLEAWRQGLYVRLGGRSWGRRQEAGGQGGDGRVFGLLEAEKCPLQSRALLKRFSGHSQRALRRCRGSCNRLAQRMEYS